MRAIDRRAVLGTLLGAVAVAAFGLALTPGSAESAPLTMDKGLIVPAGNLVEDAVVVVRRRGWHGHRRRRVCWWHRGRRICRWR
jgi:hypothetical protein